MNQQTQFSEEQLAKSPDSRLLEEVVELRYVGSGDDDFGNGTVYLIFNWEGAMKRAIRAFQNEMFSNKLSFVIRVEENRAQCTFTLTDEEKGTTHSTGLIRCSDTEISRFKTEDAIGSDQFAFGIVKVKSGPMKPIQVKHTSAYVLFH